VESGVAVGSGIGREVAVSVGADVAVAGIAVCVASIGDDLLVLAGVVADRLERGLEVLAREGVVVDPAALVHGTR
jgi:hypothetical protein